MKEERIFRSQKQKEYFDVIRSQEKLENWHKSNLFKEFLKDNLPIDGFIVVDNIGNKSQEYAFRSGLKGGDGVFFFKNPDIAEGFMAGYCFVQDEYFNYEIRKSRVKSFGGALGVEINGGFDVSGVVFIGFKIW